MPTENLPTTDTPIRPGETLLGNPPPPSPNRSGDTLLIWCFVASLIICAIFGFLLNYADLYGTQATSNQQHTMKLRVYRPPIKHKPKPKPPKIIPPKKIVPPKMITRVIPRPQPVHRPPPPAPRAISVGHKSTSKTAIDVGPTTVAPPTAAPQTPGNDTRPQAPIAAPPATPPPVITPPTPPAPVVQKPQPPPPPPPAPKPKPPAIPDRETPELLSGSFSDITLPQFDPSTLNVTSVTVNWDVDPRGNVHDIKFKPTGNSDVDQAIRTAVQNYKFSPRVINGVPQPASMSHEFDLG